MPLVKGLSVTVHTKNGPLTEYGTKKIGSGSITSSFIQSEDNTPFWINFCPTDTFKFQKPPSLNPACHLPKSKPSIYKNQPTAWDFTAHIFIDENPKADKNLIIDLPRNGKRFQPVVTARGRSCVDRKGVSGEQEWMFKEVGIEDYFRKLTTGEKMEGDEDELKAVSDNESKNYAGSATNMGQIRIELFRVRQRGMDRAKTPNRPRESSVEPPQIASGVDITHTVGVGKAKPRTFHYISVDYLDSPKEPWATIIFMYRGKKQLQKMGFALEKGRARGNSISIFQPGSPKSPSSTLSTNDNFCSFDDSNVLMESPGFVNPHTTLPCISISGKEPDIKGGKCQGPNPKNFNSPSQLKPAVCMKLKRKASHQNEITAGLSVMSLNNKDNLCSTSDVGDYSGPGRRSPKKKRTRGGSILVAGFVCQNRKVKEVVEDGSETLLA